MSDTRAKNAKPAEPGAYRVLARKYRPQTFDDLIGQEPMVRTLTNAFDSGRIAQGYMLTGVRGVGKTTTARIIARALNYFVPGKIDEPTIHMSETGEHCKAIMESRHVDVIEMDAASHTGIGDIREIIDAVRYKPADARFKVYIIDEVHMLSTAAFNGLLKTLEEPPEHVKFIFATTEIRKVPITVLSRCQRFDLRRIDAEQLVAHMRKILALEGVSADDEALAMIARAAEGSARDALSMLDQAIAHSGGAPDAAQVRDMLGLVDRSRVIELFRTIMAGDIAAALGELRAQYDGGADPVVVLSDLAAFVHLVTRFKYVPQAADDTTLSQQERSAATEFAAALDVRILSRAWQMLLKGIQEAQTAPRPLIAAEMLLVRLTHASNLPTPDELIRALDATGAATAQSRPSPAGKPSGSRLQAVAAPARASQPAPLAQAQPQADTLTLNSFEELVALAGEKRDLALKIALCEQVRVVRFEQGHIEIALGEGASRNLASDLSKRLLEWTGRRWMIALSQDQGEPTLADRQAEVRARLLAEAAGDPAVRKLLDQFPGAAIVDVRDGVLSGPALAASDGQDDMFSADEERDDLD